MKSRASSGQGCLTLFALPFAGFGTFMAVLLIKTLLTFLAAQQWQPVPAQILAVELQSHRSQKSTTYETKATYQYVFAGHAYESQRVGLQSGGDNVDDWHHRVYRELRNYRDSNQPFQAYVNPDQPSQAVLYRTVRWGKLGLTSVFAVVFGGVGYGLIIMGFVGKKLWQRKEELKFRYPDQPWRHREDWALGEVQSNARATLFFSLVAATFWNAISAPLLFLLPREILQKKNYLAAIGLLFPIVGVCLLVWAVRNIIRLRKFGKPVLQLQTLPAAIGRHLGGVIHTGKALQAEHGFTLTLDGINRRRTGTGKSRSTDEKIIHQEIQQLRPEQTRNYATGTTIPVRFSLPDDVPPTSDDDPDNRIFWRLTVKAEVPGVDYNTSFEVPVFHSSAPSPDPEPEMIGAATAQQTDMPQQKGLQIRHEGGRTIITLAPGRNPKAALGLSAFWLFWSGMFALILRLKAPLLYTTLFGLFDLGILAVVIYLWGNAARIEAGNGELRRKGGLFGLGRWKSWRADEIESLEPQTGMQANRKLYYDLKLIPRQGRPVTLASGLDSRARAEALAEIIEKVLRPR